MDLARSSVTHNYRQDRATYRFRQFKSIERTLTGQVLHKVINKKVSCVIGRFELNIFAHNEIFP